MFMPPGTCSTIYMAIRRSETASRCPPRLPPALPLAVHREAPGVVRGIWTAVGHERAKTIDVLVDDRDQFRFRCVGRQTLQQVARGRLHRVSGVLKS